MTTCGIGWTIGIIVLCIIGVAVGAARSNTKGKETPQREALKPPQKRKSSVESPFETAAHVFRRADARIVECRASTDLRRGYMVGPPGMERGEEWSRTLLYAKKELACVLAEQALAAGGIRFQLVDGELKAELCVVSRETGERTDCHTSAAALVRNDREGSGA